MQFQHNVGFHFYTSYIYNFLLDSAAQVGKA